MLLSVWAIKEVDGNGSYVVIRENEFRLSGDSAVNFPLPHYGFLLRVERFSRMFMIKKGDHGLDVVERMIVDEETKIGIYKENMTLYYGRIFLDFGDEDRGREMISFYRTPFFAELVGGKFIVFSADVGYFIYCLRCRGSIWRRTSGEAFNIEKAVSVESIVPKVIFFIGEREVRSEPADEELVRLLSELEKRLKSKGVFAKDIIYSRSTDVPEPRSPERRGFDVSERDKLDRARQSALVETICYRLLRLGKKCDIRR